VRSGVQPPTESLPIGSRVPTKNPNRSEVDPQPEPDQATWAKVSITLERSDGGIVDAEIIRPRSWILESGLCAGRMLPLNLPELEVSGLALVTAIDDCPPIACGEGSVVTARFVTREVHVVASVDVLGAEGTVETVTGTTIHPVWSVDRQSWVPLAELADGETLQGLDGLAVVLGVSLSRVSQPVYNIEVHGEHVYQVGELGLVVHNACHDLAEEIRLGGHFLAAARRTIAVGQDAAGSLFVASSNRLDSGMRAVAQRLGVKEIPSVIGKHAEEVLMEGVPDLVRIGTSKRLPCGLGEHNCLEQLISKGIEITNLGK
jgi:hypothetical protein